MPQDEICIPCRLIGKRENMVCRSHTHNPSPVSRRETDPGAASTSGPWLACRSPGEEKPRKKGTPGTPEKKKRKENESIKKGHKAGRPGGSSG